MTGAGGQERAGIWLRVSLKKQDEANQRPDVVGWCDDHGYDIAREYILRGASASKGQQQKHLDQVIEDMQKGIISVLVVWQSSRIERRGAWNAFDLARRVKDAGGRIEYVKDAYLNEANDMSDVMLALAATKDKQESRDKSERVRAAHKRSRENSAFVGAVPWGFRSDGDRYGKQLVPTPQGMTIVPEVYRRCIDGESLVTIASWLQTAAPGRKWNAESVRIMVRNPVYRGTQVNAAGRVIYRCGPLVDAATWRRANDALSNREKRGTSRTDGRALLAGVLTCADCGSPMYRSGKKGSIYRCYGRVPDRKGCGVTRKVDELDAIVDLSMKLNMDDITDWQVEPGNEAEIDAALEDVRFKIRDLASADLTDDAYDAELRRLRAERDRLNSAEKVPDKLVEKPTGETYSGKWKRLEGPERRSWLVERGITVRASRDQITVSDAAGRKLYETWA